MAHEEGNQRSEDGSEPDHERETKRHSKANHSESEEYLRDAPSHSEEKRREEIGGAYGEIERWPVRQPCQQTRYKDERHDAEDKP